MSNREWAAIVYGRSYYLDFRFITIPQDFTTQDISWASQHIIATTQQARNLSGSPRWSLFKNESYCVVGVTCMVRDLISQLGENLADAMTKDDQGRPLYVFVGYVTQLAEHQQIQNFPDYTETRLDSFKILYQEIERVWLARNYQPASRQPLLSKYQSVSFLGTTVETLDYQIPQLNHVLKYPEKIYLWTSLRQQNKLLWSRSIQCPQPTSICLNIRGKPLTNTPFLNQTSSLVERFHIKERISSTATDEKSLPELDYQVNPPLSQKISNRAREDLNLTIQQAAKLATASQELISNFNDWSHHGVADSSMQSISSDEADSFGFKSKKPSSNNQDWF